MSEILDRIAPLGGSYLATLAMAAVCGYLGLFTVLRRIVFTGVALAQLAAAGVGLSFFLADARWTPLWLADGARRYGATLGSLGASLLGAIAFRVRSRNAKLSADALVGLVYAVSAALSVLFVWRSARGLGELRNILAGEVLLTSGTDLALLWLGLVLVVLVHAWFRSDFLLVSFDPEFARAKGMRVGLLQAILLASLAVAVALSLRAGGLLLVFSLLVMPALFGLALGRRIGESSVLATLLGPAMAYPAFELALAEDLPVAPTFAMLLVGAYGLAALGGRWALVAKLLRGLTYAGAGLAILVAALAFPRMDLSLGLGGPAGDGHGHSHGATAGIPDIEVGEGDESPAEIFARAKAWLESEDEAQRREAVFLLSALGLPACAEPLASSLQDPDPELNAAARKALARMGAEPAVIAALEDMGRSSEAEVRLAAGEALLASGDRRGLPLILTTLEDPELPPFSALQVLERLRLAIAPPESLEFDPFAESAEERKEATARWREWWESARRTHRFDLRTALWRPRS